jgi:lactose/L-arabinose transport system permease protein
MKINHKPNEARFVTQFITYAFLIVGFLVSLFPFYLMFVSATHTSGDVVSYPPKLYFTNNLINNFHSLNSDIGIGKVFFNSLFITVTYTLLTIILDSMAGYALAKFEFKGKTFLFTMILVTIMIPNQVLLIPLFKLMTSINMVNTYPAVILPSLANAFGIFLMRQNMLAFPDSLIEAARIDGLSEFPIFFRIVLPTMKPAMAALGIYMFMSQWNNFMWPLVVLRTPNMYTFPLALAGLNGMSRINYGEIMLGTTLATLPIMVIFMFFQKQFVSGILNGSVKG